MAALSPKLVAKAMRSARVGYVLRYPTTCAAAATASSSANPMVLARAAASARRAIALAAGIGGARVVVMDEDLLERRLAAGQRDHLEPGQRRDQRPDPARDFAAQRVGARRRHVHAGEGRKGRRRPFR